MDYLVIADAHLGITNIDKFQVLSDLVNKTHKPIVWLGDTFDIAKQENAFNKYQHLLKPRDIVITGNHDYGISQCRSYVVGDIFLTHGDLIDFGYVFQRLQQVSYGTTKGTTLETIISKLRKWSLDDVYSLYKIIANMSDEYVSLFNHVNFKFKASSTMLLKVAFKAVLQLLILPRSQPSFMTKIVPEPKGESAMGYFTIEPKELLFRILSMYPESSNCSTIVIGHTHVPCDQTITYQNKQYRLVTLGAWVGTSKTTVGYISNGKLEVKEL